MPERRIRRRGDIVRPVAIALVTAVLTNVGQYAWAAATTVSAEQVNAWWQTYVKNWCNAHPPTAPQLEKK